MLSLIFALSITAVNGSQLQCLSKNIYYEAGVESDRGKLAVAQVTLNRAVDGNVCKVVYEKHQFSWTQKKKRKKPSGENWIASQRVAIAAMNGTKIEALEDSTHYHAEYVRPHWRKKMRRITKIGKHIYYEEKG